MAAAIEETWGGREERVDGRHTTASASSLAVAGEPCDIRQTAGLQLADATGCGRRACFCPSAARDTDTDEKRRTLVTDSYIADNWCMGEGRMKRGGL